MKKAVLSLLFLILCAAAVFVVGWVQVFVPIGKYGVLVSKTSGVDSLVIENGTFAWKWERLIPTNTDLRVFSAQSEAFTHSISGTLPSAEIYSKVAAGNPDFSYDYSIKVSLSVKSEQFPVLIQETDIQTQTELDDWLRVQSEKIARDVVQYLITNPSATGDVSGSSAATAAVMDSIGAEMYYPFVAINSIECTPVKQPDVRLYTLSRQTYEAYELNTSGQLAQEAAEGSKKAAEEYFLFERYRQLGQLLNEYPILLEYFAVQQGDAQNALADLSALEQRLESKASATEQPVAEVSSAE